MDIRLLKEKSSHVKTYRLQFIVIISLLIIINAIMYFFKTPNVKLLLLAVLVLVLWYGIRNLYVLKELNGRLQILQSMLISSYNDGNFRPVLEEIRSTCASDIVYFIETNDSGVIKSYERIDPKIKHTFLTAEELTFLINSISQNFEEEKVCMVKTKSFKQNKTVFEILTKHAVNNMTYIKIKAFDNSANGILLALNVHKLTQKYFFDKSARLLFTYALRVSYVRHLENMSKYDSLTGLLNRNSYQSLLNEYRNTLIKNIACIYIDLNGLHNINNQFGHGKGDKMLCKTANTLVNRFGAENVFRIGGDEFVIIYKYISKKDINKLIWNTQHELINLGCNVSIGVELCDKNININDAIKNAEIRMFKEKNEYYLTEKRM